MSRNLPEQPNLELLKKQAKDLIRDFRRGEAVAIERLRSQVAIGTKGQLAQAQRAIAREYGFANWPKLKHHVESLKNEKAVWFPEPAAEDDSIAHHGERT
jgi:hypothetical protein